MLPYKTIIQIDRENGMPIFLQISKSIIQEVTSGRIGPGTRLPSSRKLATLLAVNRQTIVHAYHELELQGWVSTQNTRGTYVNDQIPNWKPVSSKQESTHDKGQPIDLQESYLDYSYKFDDGSPDIRLAPLSDLGRTYAGLLRNPRFTKKYLDYQNSFLGDLTLRIALGEHLNQTRGIQLQVDQILITRGSLMAFYLFLQCIMKKGETIIVGNPGYQTFNQLVAELGRKIIMVPVDKDGIDTEQVGAICSAKQVKAVYVISHHHHPTTVTLSPERRIHLLQLAQEHGFKILEDDYDYDFHYNSSPILPLASMHHRDQVYYVGSLSKTIFPALRMGFLIGPSKQIKKMANRRRFIDRSGDPVLERAIGILLREGTIQRHLNKALLIYKHRRDQLCKILKEEFRNWIYFKQPEGGMAIWCEFDHQISLNTLTQQCRKQDLWIGGPVKYPTKDGNFTRLGFASNTEEESMKALEILKSQLRQI